MACFLAWTGRIIDLKVENKTIRPPTKHLIIPKTALHNINRNRKDPFNPVENDNMWYPKA